jgi:hypothetical protein
LPKHLTPGCKERTRTRKDVLDVRQVYEQCDEGAHADENPLASVRRLCRVLCMWDSPKNQRPDIAKMNPAAYDWWFDSGWDSLRGKIVSLDKCVDSTGALPWTHARGAIACSHFSSPPRGCGSFRQALPQPEVIRDLPQAACDSANGPAGGRPAAADGAPSRKAERDLQAQTDLRAGIQQEATG